MATWSVTDNILPEVNRQIKQNAQTTLKYAGEMFKKQAREECPVSAIRTPGYVHLRDTIDYEVDLQSLMYTSFVMFYVVKFYAEYVNNGTSRMAPRPFFTDGVLYVQDHFEELVLQQFRYMMLGHVVILK